MHVVTTTREYKGKVYRSHLLRRSYREDGKVKKETVANLTKLGDDIVAMIRQALRGEELVPASSAFDVVRSRHHGHVHAVLTAMKRLGMARLLATRASRNRDLVVAMIASRVVEAQSKLATTRWWETTTLPETTGVSDADEDELYAAMDWLLEHQGNIEKKLAARHLEEDGFVLYDLSSSYFEGKTCSLAARGHNRDRKQGKLQVNYGLMTDGRGCPVSVSVFEGNVGDPKTLLPQVEKIREEFGIERMVLVGDRGMITQRQIDVLKEHEGLRWVTALRPDGLRKLVSGEVIQMGLFDERNLFELTHPDYPGERLVACRNPELARRRAHKRQQLLLATTAELEKVQRMVERGRLRGQGNIGVRVGKVIGKYKVGKHFDLEIEDDRFVFAMNEERVGVEAAVDGVYVIRTNVDRRSLDEAQVVLGYKRLSQVERAFRSFKTIDLKVRPIFHRDANRVRAHIFLCMLAYYVQWHMQEAWRPLLFADEEVDAKAYRDPVAPATRSKSALKKAGTKRLEDGTRAHSFRTLMRHLGTIVRNTCRRGGAPEDEATFDVDTTPDATQRRALTLIEALAP